MDFFKYLRNNKYSDKTIQTYKSIIKQYINYLHDMRLIKKKLITYYGKPNTAWTHYNVLCCFLNYKKDKRIRQLKELKLPRQSRIYFKTFTKQFLYRRTDDLTNVKKVIVRFLFDTGIRAEELKNIIDIRERTMLVRGKGNKIREIIHNPDTTSYFKGFDRSTKTLRLWVKEVLGQDYTPHSIRRSHATHMLLRGANPKTVMIQLGHAKLETTYRYLQLNEKENLKIYNKYF